MRDSSWQDEGFRVNHPTVPEHEITLSSQEFSLLQKLRSFEGGSYTVLVVKTSRGRDGLHSFRVAEDGIERR
jgi:hypothetical protein